MSESKQGLTEIWTKVMYINQNTSFFSLPRAKRVKVSDVSDAVHAFLKPEKKPSTSILTAYDRDIIILPGSEAFRTK